jgi:hypothetical protein
MKQELQCPKYETLVGRLGKVNDTKSLLGRRILS